MPFPFAVHLLIVILVPLFLFGWVYRWEKRIPVRSYHPGQRSGLSLITAFWGGVVIAFPVLAILFMLPPWQGYGTYLRVATVEEVGKAILPIMLLKMQGTVSIRRTILLFMASALGFSLLENLLFLVKDPETSFIRSFTSVPLHAALSAIFGFAYGFSRYQYKGRTVWGGLAAIFLHGVYNIGLDFSVLIPFGVVVLSIGITGILWNTAQRLEESI